jgi:hypothetical protein
MTTMRTPAEDAALSGCGLRPRWGGPGVPDPPRAHDLLRNH